MLHLGATESEGPSRSSGRVDSRCGETPTSPSGSTGTALLVVRRGPASGARFLLDSDVTTAGRHPDSDIFLDDITVSRHHAEFRATGDGFSIRDMGSLNGTYVNRRRIDDASCQWRRGADR